MDRPRPVALSVAVGGVLTTGVALIAVFFPNITPEAQAAVIAFGNSVILTISILVAQSQVTPLSSPMLPEGTHVIVEGEDRGGIVTLLDTDAPPDDGDITDPRD